MFFREPLFNIITDPIHETGNMNFALRPGAVVLIFELQIENPA